MISNLLWGVMIKKYFNTIDFFKIFTNEELLILEKLFEEKYFSKNNIIYNENDPRTHFIIITSGKVEIFITKKSESKRIIILNNGKFLGEGIFFENQPHSASACEDTTLLALSKENIKILEENHLAIYNKILKYLGKIISQRLRASNIHTVKEQNLYFSSESREEHDLLGYKNVPIDAMFGIQTLRALKNFSITQIPLSHYPQMIKALAFIKKAAALANTDLNLLDKTKSKAIVQACDELLMGQHYEHFVVDMIQGGAGTSTNMNANEVIANRGLEILGHNRGEYQFLHPNDDINMAQSTNDVYPSSIKLAILLSYQKLKQAMSKLTSAFLKKGEEFSNVIKVGRTQMQDAVPMTLGQEFKAYGHMIDESIKDLDNVINNKLNILNLGGTAIGTGITADPGYGNLVFIYLRELTGINEIKIADDLIQATQDTSHFVSYSSVLKNLSLKLSKIANDLRLLSSGPRAGLNEINLPARQPGSTIMPGKVNPVIPEVVNQVAFQVIGNDITVNLASEAGQLELNAMEPVIAFNLFQSQDMLVNVINTFVSKCIEGITANKEYCRKQVENSISLVTALNPYIGYENATKAAKIALKDNKSIYEVVLEENMISKEKLDTIMLPENLITSTKKFI